MTKHDAETVARWQAAMVGWNVCKEYEPNGLFVTPDSDTGDMRGGDHTNCEQVIDLSTDTGLIDAVELAKITLHSAGASGKRWYWSDRFIWNPADTWREAALAAVDAAIDRWLEGEQG